MTNHTHYTFQGSVSYDRSDKFDSSFKDVKKALSKNYRNSEMNANESHNVSDIKHELYEPNKKRNPKNRKSKMSLIKSKVSDDQIVV